MVLRNVLGCLVPAVMYDFSVCSIMAIWSPTHGVAPRYCNTVFRTPRRCHKHIDISLLLVVRIRDFLFLTWKGGPRNVQGRMYFQCGHCVPAGLGLSMSEMYLGSISGAPVLPIFEKWTLRAPFYMLIWCCRCALGAMGGARATYLHTCAHS